MNEKVLVLGGSYFIGRRIATVLNKAGYEVSILNRGMKTLPSDNIRQIICDRSNADEMKKSLGNSDYDYIIDVSWQDMEWVEILCSSACFDHVKSFVFLSSSAVYDIEHLQIPFSEIADLAVNKYWTNYGKGKIEAEKYYQNFFKDKKTGLIILRPPYIYGEDNYAQRESFVFNHISEEKPIIIPKSNPKLQFMHSDDLANIIRYLMQLNIEETVIYNVGNKNPISTKEWINRCSHIVGKTAKLIECDYQSMGRNIRDFFPFYDYDNVLDVSKINSLYQKEIPFDEGLKRAYDWYLGNNENIILKQNVEQNILDMIEELSQ